MNPNKNIVASTVKYAAALLEEEKLFVKTDKASGGPVHEQEMFLHNIV